MNLKRLSRLSAAKFSRITKWNFQIEVFNELFKARWHFQREIMSLFSNELNSSKEKQTYLKTIEIFANLTYHNVL